ncbi:hypothetical protein CEXT_348881 [Caerostris extrusa]|uniref:Uncharacterized protein n=1 Tax=Caerostris extrusa TaxID=172846 RepID=A0AAV4XSU4_CAEEX|nr:hypothetical protein CEXT_348881 [Caerostris extrusa]
MWAAILLHDRERKESERNSYTGEGGGAQQGWGWGLICMSDEGVVPTSLPDEPSTSIFLHPTPPSPPFSWRRKEDVSLAGWKKPPFLHISDGDLVEKGVSPL